ncbi:MAG: hypothetical protein RR938_08630 [Muribaculaceae bacterium]
MIKSILISLALLFATVQGAIAQGFNWSVDLNAFFDNREGDDFYTPAETIFATRLAPEIGISFLGGAHSIAGGVSWIQPVGNGWNDYKLCPTLYYRYMSPTWRFTFGMLPRTQLIEHLPNALWSDKMAFNEPNIRGFLIQYVRPQGYAELSLDWRGLQSETQREAFNVNFNGEWNPKGIFLIGGHVMVNHFAKQKNPPTGQNIVDDMVVNPMIGINLSKVTPLDSFTIKGGLLLSLERDRNNDNWQTPCGALIDIVAEWRFLGIKNTLYAGKAQFPLYGDFGAALNMGEPYYQAPFYNRTNVYAYVFRNRFVNLEASLNFHVTKKAFGFQQQLLLRVYMDNELWSKRNEKNARGEHLRNIY